MAYQINYNPTTTFDTAVGVKLPLVSKDGVLFDLSYTTYDQAMSNLKNLLLTRTGERIMQPLFGTNVYDSLFEHDTADRKMLIKNSITEAVDFWLPYISITTLNIEEADIEGTSMEGYIVTVQASVNGQSNGVPITYLITTEGINELE